MKKLNISHHFKNYFTFSRSERNGIILILILIVLIIVATKLIPKPEENNQENFAALKREVDSLFIEDVSASEKSSSPKSTSGSKARAQEQTIELNSSDSAELTKLPGIGPVFASRIIKYRNLLGGFYSVSQLKEVYGLKEENLNKAINYVRVDKKLIALILPDTAGFKTLARHPYIGKEKAWKIINLRKKNNSKFQPSDLINQNIFDSIQWNRVEPYLVFSKI